VTRALDDLTVVMVTFNSAHCISALASAMATHPKVIVVDNASEDGTEGQVRLHLPQAQFIRNAQNLGFGAANNIALRRVDSPYALLLNPDCLPTAGVFSDFLAQADIHSEAAIIAPHLIRKNGELELSYRWPAKLWASKGPRAEGPCSVGFACGAALLLNMNKMSATGFFDEDYFLYYEDEDLCQRAFDRKLSIVLAPSLEIAHLSRGSVKGKTPLRFEYLRGYHHAQSKLIFESKHVGLGQAKALKRKTLALALVSLPLRLIFFQPRYLARLWGRIRGLIDRTL
jgi:N-acetylglucosaminyl-diphospho-decaprenol L-rhamnosyltransferase